MKIEGFKKVTYNDLQKEIRAAHNPNVLPEIAIAANINVKAVQTVKNAFNMDTQIVSDDVLTGVLGQLGLNSFVLWQNGERFYYIGTNKK